MVIPLILLLDIDGVLQFGRPDFEEHILNLGWRGSYHEFQRALFLDPEYRATLIGKADIRSVLRRMLTQLDQVIDVDVLMHQWAGANLTFNEDLLELIPRFEAQTTRLATNQDPIRGSSIRSIYQDRTGIDGMYFSHEIGHRKPFEEYFQYIVDDLGCSPSDVVFVDDSPENVAGAEAFGFSAIAYENNEILAGQLLACGIRCLT